jgi:hypothetical protein
MAKAQLDPTWWKKNAPQSLAAGAIGGALGNFSKIKASLEKNGDVKSFTKCVEDLKKAIGKDQQSAKKAKDKEGEKILLELASLADEAKQQAEGHLEIKSASGAPSSEGGQKIALAALAKGAKAASEDGGKGGKPGGGGADAVGAIVNALDKAWQIVKDGAPQSSAKRSACQAVPDNVAFTDLYGWQQRATEWQYKATNKLGIDTVVLDFKLSYRYGGQTDAFPGVFLTDYGVYADAEVLWGYSVDVDANARNPHNSGGRDSAVGAIELLLSVQTKTVLKNATTNWQITCHGNGKRDVA